MSVVLDNGFNFHSLGSGTQARGSLFRSVKRPRSLGVRMMLLGEPDVSETPLLGDRIGRVVRATRRIAWTVFPDNPADDGGRHGLSRVL